MKITSYLLGICIFLLCSCRTPNDITYFENLQIGQPNGEIPSSAVNYELKLEPSDEIAILVNGKDPRAVALYNLPTPPTGNSNSATTSASEIGVPTYTVDAKGNIDFPILGKIHVAGKTLNELKEELQDKISKDVKDPIANITLRNFKVSVMGEVTNPGMLNLNTQKVTILDAISMAGDITITGMRNNILLLREEEGKKQFHRIDLTKTDLFSSPFYYLKQNDVIYISPNEARRNASKIDPSKQYNLSVASTITSTISVIASLCIALFLK